MIQQELNEAIAFNEQSEIADNMDIYLDVDFETIYHSLSDKEKNLFWKRIVKYIVDGQVMYSDTRKSVQVYEYIKLTSKSFC